MNIITFSEAGLIWGLYQFSVGVPNKLATECRCCVIHIVVISQCLMGTEELSSLLYTENLRRRRASPVHYEKYAPVSTNKTRPTMFVGTLWLLPQGHCFWKHVSVTSKSVLTQISKPSVNHLIATVPELLAQSCVVSSFVAVRASMHH